MSGSPARTATAEDLFERRVPHLYHLADDSVAISVACHAMAVLFHGRATRAVFGNGSASTDAHIDDVLVARSDDPWVIKEVHVATCHVHGELAHVFCEHPGLLAPEVVS